MNKKIGVLAFLLILCVAMQAQVVLKRGMAISKSVKISKRTYALNGFDNLNKGVIIIKGDNITVDFNKAVLQGSNGKKTPDEFYGVAVLITGGRNITIKNLTAKGYKVALIARNVDGLKIENCDFSYNYRKRLNSTQEKEDISDWMNYHRNENDEWLRYGAAIYLRNCNNAIISGNKVTGGQNALMMTACNRGTIYNNDFSYNSGIGIGFYRSSGNKILHNRVNFNVRGYSHGVYNRGQDSAGFLVYEQSSNNLFYKNSATHSGDGFFLWAGQTTMDTGKGGCNDNQILYNDFSYAPTNGIEVTFSRNSIANNRIFECDHGIWGGYSYQTGIADNQFRDNRIAIAIEHGQHNEITGNTFIRNKEAIRLWARPQQPADWGYAKHRDTRSVGIVIGTNNFSRNGTVFNLQRSDSLYVFDNTLSDNDNLYQIDSTVTNIDSAPRRVFDTAAVDYSLPNGMDAFKGNGRLAGRKNIRMTTWGPYDFRYPLLWHTNPVDTGNVLTFDVLGPKGKWKILSAKGVGAFKAGADSFPSSISFDRKAGEKQDIEIIAEYRGPAFTDVFGKKVAAGKPYRFYFRKFFQPVAFTINWYAFDSTNNPLEERFSPGIRKPFKTEQTNKLDYAWWGGIKTTDSTFKQFLTVAEGTAFFDKGLYEIAVTWDDAVRVYIDGRRVLDQWDPAIHTFDEAPNKKIRLSLGGKHTFRVEHVELGGFATLALKIVKANLH
ncbi:MAG TPA: right-handed parallel beta-helix repeat-containing protein [Flavisolibacter sp.]|jgi:parallel beta-helix repeat protein|nr:right-handed parallel beta-helix repeat-containing protein [Flavisolibacter sp.]